MLGIGNFCAVNSVNHITQSFREKEIGMKKLSPVEYIWVDNQYPSQPLRSQTRMLHLPERPQLKDFPVWQNANFAASASDSAAARDCAAARVCTTSTKTAAWSLIPVRMYRDPLQFDGKFLLMCEVCDTHGDPHAANYRSRLRTLMNSVAGEAIEPWLGFEQQYTLLRDGRPLGFPSEGLPKPQGPYVWGAESDNVYGREIAEAHAAACMVAGILICGINAEVTPGQWEFQIGYRGFERESSDALAVADDVCLARFLLLRIAEQHGVKISFSGDAQNREWRGAAMHTKFSTALTRDPLLGLEAIYIIIAEIRKRAASNADVLQAITYNNSALHIPHPVARKGYGYLEDRRPAGDEDPYCVALSLIAAAIEGVLENSAASDAA